MTEAGKRLLEAANEALAIAEGRADPSTYVVHAPPAVDVRAIRKSVNMTQAAFGERFGFGTARVRDWERNRTRPTASDHVLLITIRYAASVVLEALEAGGTPEAPSDATTSDGREARATQTRRALARAPRQKSVA